MSATDQLAAAAELFKALGSPARLALVQELAQGPLSVSALSERTGMSQPLVSQHLRVLRVVGVVGVERMGRERIHELADEHVHHIVQDTLAHVGHASTIGPIDPPEEHPMSHDTAEHTFDEHTHGEHCGHEAIQHGDHVDYDHDGHKHALHGDHYDEH